MPQAFAGGRYLIRGFLGEGGRKRVYLAHDQKLDRDVAFALIKTEGLDADGMVRVRRETQAMGRLGDHPHIVTIHDVGEENGQQYIVSQYLEGGSIEDVIAKADGGKLSPDHAMRIAEEICFALEHAHAHGIIHRDLKPGNVWLTADGAARLGDFGLAVALDRSRMTMQGMMVGTVAYMSPEQALGRTPDARSDLYSLGATLYEMVTGRPPFLGDDAVGVISQHINTAAVAPSWHNPELPKPLDSLILRLLAKAPDDRYGTAAEVAKELRRVINRTTEESVVRPQAQVITDLRGLAWGRFVGRHEELSQLKGALESALSGSLSLAFIAGEPGIGKTRLAEEFAVYCGLRGAQVLQGRCYEGEESLPFRPFVEALRQYARTKPDAEVRQQMGQGAAIMATLISEIRERFPDVEESPRLEGEADRLRLFDSVSEFLLRASVAQPLVLFLDDLHWGDKPTLLMLQHVARHASSSRVLVLSTYRDVDLDRAHLLSDTLTELRRLPAFQRLALRGLPPECVEELLSSMDPAEEGEAARHLLAAALYRETEGNPFFIREVLAHLVETGKLVREGGRWVGRVQSVSELGIPEGVREVIGRRLSRLSEGCNRLLTHASTMTRGFTWDALVAISDEPEAQLIEHLEEALRSNVIAERKGDASLVYDFAHALVRQTLYEELSGPRRVLTHRRIAEALESLYSANLEPHLPELAHHFYQAAPGGDVQKAVEYCMRAGDRAMQLYAWEEAVEHYNRGLAALDLEQPLDHARRCDILLSLSEALWSAGDYDSAQRAAAEAVELARLQQDPQSFARAALDHSGRLPAFSTLVRNQPAVDMLDEALAALGEGDNRIKAKVMARLAEELATHPDYQRREELCREAIAMARRLGNQRDLAFVLSATNLPLWSPQNIAERLANAMELVALGEATGDRAAVANGHNWTYMCRLEEAGVDKEVLALCVRLVEELRLPYLRWIVHTFAVQLAMLEGRLADTLVLAEDGRRMGEEAQSQSGAFVFGMQTLWVMTLQGRLAELEQGLLAARHAYPFIDAILTCVLGLDYAYAGRLDEARAKLEPYAAAEFVDVPRHVGWLFTIAQTAEAVAILGDSEWSKVLYRLLEPHATLNVIVGHIVAVAPVSYYLGRLATVLRDWDTATIHFDAALKRANENDALLWKTMVEQGYAEMLLARNASGDRQKALELLDDALAIAQETGAKLYLDRALALKLKAQGVDGADPYTSIDRVLSSAESVHPDLKQHAAPDGTVTIVFSDIEGSTELADRLGDKRFMEVLREHNAIVRDKLAAFGGYEVKNEGDGFMLAFQSARRALDCAAEIQRALAERAEACDEPVLVRMGLHSGEAIKEGDDFFGRNVILAARIAGQAGGGEIFVSSLLKALVESAGDISWGEPRAVELKGLSGTHEIWPVAWA
jgi:predicted ATPase/class 3 adenylate cyclase